MTENPYESPTAKETSRKRFGRSKSVGSILILLAMLPAAGIAGFTICLGVADNTPPSTTQDYGLGQLMTGLVAGVICGAVVLGLMLWWAIALGRKSREQPRVWTDVDGAKIDAALVWWDEKDVLLRTKDTKEVQVPIEKLCDGDREWLKGRE